MRCSLSLLLLLLFIGVASAVEPVQVPLESLSLPQLEQDLTEIDSELEQLASFTPRGGVGALGFRTRIHTEPESKETIRIELGEEVAVDEVVLVPCLFRDSKSGLRSEGFPIAFRILAGTAHATKVVATFSAEDHLLPRIAPLAVRFEPIKASWIAIEVTGLSQTPDVKDQHTLQLSEIMVFSGMENVALPPPQAFTISKSPWRERFLTDGFTPFLMDAAQGSPSQTKVIRVESLEYPPTLTIDLKASLPVHQINLHTADVALSIPTQELSCWAVPRHVRVIGANRPDFADETFLCEYQQKSLYDNGPIIMRRFPETHCRYIRLVILNPQPIASLNEDESSIAFSEIEVLSKSENIARGAKVTASSNLSCSKDTLIRMTDGFNYNGKILSIRDWMNQLSRRHDLEAERPLVAAELSRRYAAQKTKLRHMSWLAAILAAATVIGILIERLFYLKKIEKMRIRFAADLHDELGANLHTIALLSDAATVAHESAEEWQMLHRRIRDLVGRTGIAIRHFSNIDNADGLYLGLVEDMQRASRRILAKLEHSMDISGEEFLGRLKIHTQVDLFLFYQESLMNICRHSDATRASTHLTASAGEIILSISDNGKGLSEKNIPSSLKRRARLLKAKLTIEASSEGGTSISLRLRNGRGLWGGKSKALSHATRNITSL